ncbi:acyltransferase [Mesorhizobium argentiipisi]|uniref:Acyltransferase n=1 Tax=Mesorhizobium argentiipisi TaxID=3015175 RepID=A0ABU8KFK9_9HYPH
MIRLHNLDGLRGFAALLVVLSHLCGQLGILGFIFEGGGGQVGVQVFFALSGFLIGSIYLNYPIKRVEAADFVARRVARVLPLYLAVVVVSYCLGYIAGVPVIYDVNKQNLLDHLLLVKAVSVMWTIPVEIHFYMIFLVIWGVFSISKGAGIVLSMASIPVLLFVPDPMALRPFLMAFFLVGIVFSQVPTIGSSGAFALALCATIVAMPAVSKLLGLDFFEFWRSPLNAVAVGALVYTAAHAPIATKFLGSGIARYIGMISFSIYLLHWPIMAIITTYTKITTEPLLYLCCVIAVTVVLSSISYYLIEAPAKRLIAKGRPTRNPASVPSPFGAPF